MLPKGQIAGFELIAEVQGQGGLQHGQTTLATIETNDWTPLRVRTAGTRSQVWLNQRVASDELFQTAVGPGRLTANGIQMRKIRIRPILD